MYTVVICDQEHINGISEYEVFLQPFMKQNKFGLCCWKPAETTLAESVPDLFAKVGYHEHWRAIVVCDEDGIYNKNPFDVISFPELSQNVDEEDNAFLKRNVEAKIETYKAAASRPFVRLMTWLIDDAMTNSRSFSQAELDDMSDPTMWEYRKLSMAKREIRKEIRGNVPNPITFPSEVVCISKRVRNQAANELETMWSEHVEHQYTSFYDSNMYFDKMRYLTYDMEDQDKLRYQYDYVRFLFSLHMLAAPEADFSCLMPNRVYNMKCEFNTARLSEFLSKYETKLELTQKQIEYAIQDLKSRPEDRLSDKDAERIFCARINVPVNFGKDFDRTPLYFLDSFGLTGDCPMDEVTTWDDASYRSKRSLHSLLKQPQRAIARASEDVHRLAVFEEERALLLNEFQAGDVSEYVDNEEKAMIKTLCGTLKDNDYYVEQMETAAKRVDEAVKRHIRKRPAVILGIVALAIVAASMVPMLIANFAKASYIRDNVILLVIAVAGLGAAAVIILLIFYMQLHKEIQLFNKTMSDICDEIDHDLDMFGTYLSHVCNVLRGNAALIYREKYGQQNGKRIAIYKKHTADIQERRALVSDVFGSFMIKGRTSFGHDVFPFNYDFTRAVDYEYPLVLDASDTTQVPFLQVGNTITAPVDFVEELLVTREELYE